MILHFNAAKLEAHPTKVQLALEEQQQHQHSVLFSSNIFPAAAGRAESSSRQPWSSQQDLSFARNEWSPHPHQQQRHTRFFVDSEDVTVLLGRSLKIGRLLDDEDDSIEPSRAVHHSQHRFIQEGEGLSISDFLASSMPDQCGRQSEDDEESVDSLELYRRRGNRNKNLSAFGRRDNRRSKRRRRSSNNSAQQSSER